jgi:hypothetical protein
MKQILISYILRIFKRNAQNDSESANGESSNKVLANRRVVRFVDCENFNRERFSIERMEEVSLRNLHLTVIAGEENYRKFTKQHIMKCSFLLSKSLVTDHWIISWLDVHFIIDTSNESSASSWSN